MFELDGSYFAEDVTREFGENRVVAGRLTVVHPLNDYVREHGRNLTIRAGDICHESASGNHVLQDINGVQVCIACGKCA